MRPHCFVYLFAILISAMALAQSNPVPVINQSAKVAFPISGSQPDPKSQAKILDTYGKLPLSFEANHGQANARVKSLIKVWHAGGGKKLVAFRFRIALLA
jgi:hypothetical protein